MTHYEPLNRSSLPCSASTWCCSLLLTFLDWHDKAAMSGKAKERHEASRARGGVEPLNPVFEALLLRLDAWVERQACEEGAAGMRRGRLGSGKTGRS